MGKCAFGTVAAAESVVEAVGRPACSIGQFDASLPTPTLSPSGANTSIPGAKSIAIAPRPAPYGIVRRSAAIHSNVPMNLAGAAHLNKDASRLLLSQAVVDGEVLVTDAEVRQEILHRYVALDRREAIDDAISALLGVVDEVDPVERQDVLRARTILEEASVSARDAIHAAVMHRHAITRILTFDKGFDALSGLVRAASEH